MLQSYYSLAMIIDFHLNGSTFPILPIKSVCLYSTRSGVRLMMMGR